MTPPEMGPKFCRGQMIFDGQTKEGTHHIELHNEIDRLNARIRELELKLKKITQRDLGDLESSQPPGGVR